MSNVATMTRNELVAYAESSLKVQNKARRERKAIEKEKATLDLIGCDRVRTFIQVRLDQFSKARVIVEVSQRYGVSKAIATEVVSYAR